MRSLIISAIGLTICVLSYLAAFAFLSVILPYSSSPHGWQWVVVAIAMIVTIFIINLANNVIENRFLKPLLQKWLGNTHTGRRQAGFYTIGFQAGVKSITRVFRLEERDEWHGTNVCFTGLTIESCEQFIQKNLDQFEHGWGYWALHEDILDFDIYHDDSKDRNLGLICFYDKNGERCKERPSPLLV